MNGSPPEWQRGITVGIPYQERTYGADGRYFTVGGMLALHTA